MIITILISEQPRISREHVVQTEQPKKQYEQKPCVTYWQELTDTSKQPIRTRYLGHVTGYPPIRDQHFLIRSVPVSWQLPHSLEITPRGNGEVM